MSAADVDFYTLDPATQAYILQTRPALEPPIGQQPNFDNPPNGTTGVIVLFSICMFLMTVTLIGRVYMRFFHMKEKALVDYLLILAYALTIVNFYFTLLMVENPGIFIHQYNVRLGDFIGFLKNVFITFQLYLGSICLIKVSILLDWVRIFAPTGRGFVYWAGHFTIWANIGVYIAIFVTFNSLCTPYALNWDVMLKGNCNRLNKHYTNLATSIFNVISDLMILAIPQRAIWTLHMSTKKKIGVSVVFAFGLLACFSALIRLIEVVRDDQSPDLVYTFSGFLCCAAAELTCGFLVISVPSFPKAFSSVPLGRLLLSRMGFNLPATSKPRSSQKPKAAANNSDGSSWPSSHAARYYEMRRMEKPAASAEVDERRLVFIHPAGSRETSLHENVDLEGGIYRTTRFETSESYDPDAVRSDYRYQEQWDVIRTTPKA